MQFKDMYAKPIDRPIDAVVKAGSVEHLANELDEYVITSELAGHLQRFYDEYNDVDATGNGAWISGFFGSGKSHMLKILAVMLEDKEVAGMRALDYILPKVEDNPSLKGSMEVARAKHPSESVLFDINAFAPNESRSSKGGILAAFLKAFNSHCGYFSGDQQHIAQLEYDLDRGGRLDAFKSAVKDKTGKEWDDIRSSALIYKTKISSAFDEVCGNEPGTTTDIVGDYNKAFDPSIEGFAQRVGEYLGTKDPGFRINFFVDEVGQYIAKNPNLMVDLQTIAEQLNIITDGNSWVMVTSQENVEDVIGQMTERSANDFSKIQARFKVKMALTSKDAKTVIQQRLLAKSKDAIPEIESIYDRNQADFRVLFDFVDGSKTYKTYQDAQDFVDTYPFVPYQFDLFITAMRGLSDYNAFTGRHHSTGARSMLGVFQDVATKLADAQGSGHPGSTEEETLASFDAMFEGLRNSIKSEVCGQISIAENQLSDNPLAIRALKALFLVKYCKDFKATPKNLRVLLYGSFRENTSALEQQLKDVLEDLKNQLYIRQHPDSNIYEYLTDEEKDIEREIRNTPITNSDIEKVISGFYDEIAGAKRVPYRNGSFTHNFSYNMKINGSAQGQQRNDLTLDIVTNYVSDNPLETMPTSPKTLYIVLNNANEFLNNVRVYEQTNKFANMVTGKGEVRQAIIQDKRTGNQALAKKLVEDLSDLISKATYLSAGVDVTASISGTGKACIESGMTELIRRSYTGLQQIRANITDNDVHKDVLTKRLPGATEEYVETVFTRIGLLSGTGSVTIGGDGPTSLKATFTKNEFGWPEIYVRSAIAILYSEGRVEVRKGGSLVEGTKLADALKRDVDMEKYVVSKMTDVSPEELSSIREAFRKVTSTNPQESGAKQIAKEFGNYLGSIIEPLKNAIDQVGQYPFAEQYKDKLSLLEKAVKDARDNWNWIVNPFPAKADEIAEANADLSKMKQFADGSGPGKRWKEIRSFCDSDLQEAKELSIPSMEDPEFVNSLAIADDPDCYKSGKIPVVANAVKKARLEISEAKESLRAAAIEDLRAYKKSFEQSYDLDAISESARSSFNRIFDDAEAEVSSISQAYRISGFYDEFKKFNASRLMDLVTPKPLQGASGGGGEPNGGDTTPPPAPKPVTVDLSSLNVSGYAKPAISTRQDVDEYVDALKDKLLEQIDAGHTIMR